MRSSLKKKGGEARIEVHLEEKVSCEEEGMASLVTIFIQASLQVQYTLNYFSIQGAKVGIQWGNMWFLEKWIK